MAEKRCNECPHFSKCVAENVNPGSERCDELCSIKRIGFYTTRGKYGFMSNFFNDPQTIDGVRYKTNEHYYQSQKAAIDHHMRDWIASAPTPFMAMRAGRSLRVYEIVKDWQTKKVEIMRRGLRAKFTQNPTLKQYLLETADAELYEDSPTDKFWGIKGKNMLGILLMELRDELRSVE